MELLGIKEKVAALVTEFSSGSVRTTPTHDEVLDNHLDSLDRVEIMMTLEDKFEIEINDEDWLTATKDKPFTVTLISEFIHKKLNE